MMMMFLCLLYDNQRLNRGLLQILSLCPWYNAVITRMASPIYGRRTSKRRAEKIKACVEQVYKQET